MSVSSDSILSADIGRISITWTLSFVKYYLKTPEQYSFSFKHLYEYVSVTLSYIVETHLSTSLLVWSWGLLQLLLFNTQYEHINIWDKPWQLVHTEDHVFTICNSQIDILFSYQIHLVKKFQNSVLKFKNILSNFRASIMFYRTVIFFN